MDEDLPSKSPPPLEPEVEDPKDAAKDDEGSREHLKWPDSHTPDSKQEDVTIKEVTFSAKRGKRKIVKVEQKTKLYFLSF